MDNVFTTFEVEVKGVAPILLHNGNMANPFNPHVKAMKELQANAKRNKTDEFYFQLAKLEWYAGLYLNSKKEPIIPQDVLIACMVKAGKRQKKGDIVKSCIFVESDMKLIYTGPKDIDAMWEDESFRDQRIVVNPATKSRILRTRPIIHDWGGKFRVSFDHEQVSDSQVNSLLATAGRFCGLGDYRPTYGRFEIASVKPV